MTPSILNLRNDAAASPANDGDEGGLSSIATEILNGLRKTERIVPGRSSEDEQYAFTKTIPTMILYDDKGLDIYDRITALEEYYLYSSELAILEKHGADIARRLFGSNPTSAATPNKVKEAISANEASVSPSRSTNSASEDDGKSNDDENEEDHDIPSDSGYGDREERAKKERWGDGAVGKNNFGVNGNLGLEDNQSRCSGSVIELGAGSLKKTSVLLRNLAELLKTGNVDSLKYYALDLEHGQLVSTLEQLERKESDSITLDTGKSVRSNGKKIIASGICASYEEAFPYLKQGKLGKADTEDTSKKCILFLGSSVGNYSRTEAVDFLRNISDTAMSAGDSMLIGIDSCDDKLRVETAYNDPQGVTRDFILNGIDHANRILGGSAGLSRNDFEYVSRYNQGEGRHEAYLRVKVDIALKVPGGEIQLIRDELVSIERSYKYTLDEAEALFAAVGLRIVARWNDTDRTGDYNLFMVEKPPFGFPSTLETVEKGGNPFGLPTIAEWDSLWKAWDCVTLSMIPQDLLHSKPIDLRHICLFYLGHIPGFLDIHMSRYLKAPYTEPAHFPDMFERGIDPNMDDPSKVHAHSVVPSRMEDWPSLDEIVEYRDRVRARLHSVYSELLSDSDRIDTRLVRTMSMVYEHEVMHLETLLYMCAQIAPGKLKAAPSFSICDFKQLTEMWNLEVALEQRDTRALVTSFGQSTIEIGHDDFDHLDSQTKYDPSHTFGWDNESPKRSVVVAAFNISLLPISNEDYRVFFEKSGSPRSLLPGSWTEISAGKYGIKVLTQPSVVPLELAKEWPCMASGKQLAAYATSVGGRLPTEPELRRFMLDHPADHIGSNIGFRNWHPVPARLPKTLRDGTKTGASNGGVWEWTCTDFAAHEGWRASELYPDYSKDFHDGCHWVMLGGSFATIPRVAGRKTFTNWYQANYPYVFAGARVAYDA